MWYRKNDSSSVSEEMLRMKPIGMTSVGELEEDFENI